MLVHYSLNSTDHLILDPAKFSASDLSPPPPNCSTLTDLCFPTFHESFCGDSKPLRPFKFIVHIPVTILFFITTMFVLHAIVSVIATITVSATVSSSYYSHNWICLVIWYIILPGSPVAQLGPNGLSSYGRWSSDYFIVVSTTFIICTNGGKTAHCSTLQIFCGCHYWVPKSLSGHRL